MSDYRIICVHMDDLPSIIAKPRTRQGCEDKLRDIIVDKGFLQMYSQGSDRYDMDLDVHYVGDPELAELAHRQHIAFKVVDEVMTIHDWAICKSNEEMIVYLQSCREHGKKVLGTEPHFIDGYRREFVLDEPRDGRICHNCAHFMDVDTTCPRFRGKGQFRASLAAVDCPDYYFCPIRKEVIE